MTMKRRKFLTAGVAGAAALGLASCAKKEEKTPTPTTPAKTEKTREWKMVTTWPKNFPGLGTGANKLAEYITTMSGGRLKVTVYGGGELVPPLEIFDAVSKGTAEMGHGAAYYWAGKAPAAQFFAAVPFGLTAQEMNGWLYAGGGQELWDELYADFNLKPFAAGNTGVQMGGWFNREIHDIADLTGLKIRMPGLGGKVLSELGATPKLLPGGEIFTSLQSGAIDATEWVGPYNDLAFGLYKVAKFYYYPGWHEPGTTLEAFVNKQAYDALPADLQEVITVACQAANNDMLGEFTARNGAALRTLVDVHKVQLRKFPDSVLRGLHKTSLAVVAQVAAEDPFSRKVYDSFSAFLGDVDGWTRLSETAYTLARDLELKDLKLNE